MSIIDFIMKMPCWYVLILTLFSFFYGIREIIERKTIRLPKEANKEAKEAINEKREPVIVSNTKKIIIYYVRDFLSQSTFTISSFIALFIANYIFSSIESFKDISGGTAILLIFLIIWGVTGGSGYLGYIIVAGKFKSK